MRVENFFVCVKKLLFISVDYQFISNYFVMIVAEEAKRKKE